MNINFKRELVKLKFEPDPRGIGYAFHGAGAKIGQKGAFCKGLTANYFFDRPESKQNNLQSHGGSLRLKK
ncbi:MAG: hypothetical protein BA867_14130 [Desulfobacterales bacterium S5133MH16]|jgi:hypothetical protein|nr:MAG: hypothetical protein BA867_14130 [Desulfobacterales bacterium S5133MH16]